MKKAALLLTGLMGMLLSSAAMAEAWLGVNYAMPEQDNRFTAQFPGDEKFDTGDLFLRLGADINEVFSSELRAGLTVSPKEENDVTFEHDYIVGAFLRADYEMSFFKPYVTVGVIRGQESLELANGTTFEDEFDDIAAGVGADMQFGDSFGLNVEFTRYYDIGDTMLKGPSAGVYWKF